MDKNTVIWHVNDNRHSIGTIPKLMRRQVLVPYFEMQENGD